ncbi:hypothetical protein AVEN_101136-1 [Araneus ventricosus]|uniref:Uncharacterized protein n=1 Tax=Araneus ventricosus TaxID=182803 RepID=A0A4Y2DCT4_ARAVE|nr:hypothetical protein AVEN_101136-1 [Araneus ventricosus]
MAPRRFLLSSVHEYELGITCGRKVVADSSLLLAVRWVLRVFYSHRQGVELRLPFPTLDNGTAGSPTAHLPSGQPLLWEEVRTEKNPTYCQCFGETRKRADLYYFGETIKRADLYYFGETRNGADLYCSGKPKPPLLTCENGVPPLLTTNGETPLLCEQELWRQSLEELFVCVEATSASDSKISAAFFIWARSSNDFEMAFLAKFKKVDLSRLEEELEIEITSEDRILDICRKNKNSPDYDEEFAKGQLEVIAQDREAELAMKERETERAYELEKLKIAGAAETASLNSTRSEGSRNRREIKHLMQKFDSQNTDISLYLTLFGRQARAARIEEEEWVSKLISLLPLDLAQIIIKEPEEQMREYTNVMKVLLDRFKMKPETFRIKFTQHQRRQGALWKELVFELRNYFDGWVEGLNVKDFKSLKDLMIADQLKRRVSSEVKDHFLDEWGELIDPLVLAGKLDQYESVRGNRKVNPVRMAERKPLDRARQNSPKKEHPAKNAEKTEHQFGKVSAPKGNWRNENFERERRPLVIYAIRPRIYDRIASS